MSLSRHFYPLEDVHVALRYTCGRSNPVEAVFWCQELLWSGCASEAVSTLFESWLWQIGPFRLAWLSSAWTALAGEEVTEEAILLAAYRLGTLSSSQCDHSLWHILVLATQEAPERLTRKTPASLPSSDPKEVYFVRALYQGKARCSWWIAQYMEPVRLWELMEWYIHHLLQDSRDTYLLCLQALQGYNALLGYSSEEYDIVVRCAAVLMLCLSPSQRAESLRPLLPTLDERVLTNLADWKAAYGTIWVRLFAILPLCLYGTTARGRSRWSQYNVGQLHHVEKYLIGCPFWDEALADYATVEESGVIQWHSEDAMEDFYDKYFPDDIPDEWTKNDKEVSHGGGVLGPDESVTLWKYAIIFLSRPSRLAWGTTHTMLRHLEGISCASLVNPSSLLTGRVYPLPWDETLSASLKPAHKRNIVG